MSCKIQRFTYVNFWCNMVQQNQLCTAFFQSSRSLVSVSLCNLHRNIVTIRGIKFWKKPCYVPVKSKLEHPPCATPRAFEFFKLFDQTPPPPIRAEKLFKCPLITVLTFQYLLLYFCSCVCEHGLLDNTLIKSNIVDELAITSRVAAKIVFIN